ncbi:AAA family ATPase [Granulicella sibirica]|uniref:Cell division protein FtsH n=1 Tax=Granulicella sibirica TaxID=2479048 RepID=A0A4Q0SW39_9BACT|nr:AAA family ATPase [Granulicella sibirica]RXH53778.1 Cell division protein FtsH [Granulicella sibirica]
MASLLFLEGGKSTYNINVGVVQESKTLTTASQQYWAQRQAKTFSQLTRVQVDTSSSTAELDWIKFCRANTTFLDRLLWRGVDRLEKALRVYWKGNKTLSKEARRLFGKDAAIEILIPLSHIPLRFVVISPRSAELQIRTSDNADGVKAFQLGRPYVSVSWKGQGFFVITPTGEQVVMQTYYIDHPSLGHWSTDDVLPNLFADTVREFSAELDAVSTHFGPMLRLLNNRDLLEKIDGSLRRMRDSAEAWSLVHLPESQKLEILRALELFESCDAAAPRGLLLTGPSGVGKSLLGKTIAETVGRSFQHLTPASLKLDHLGGSGRRVREVWEEARRHQPSILYLDECEGVLGRRGAAETDAISTEIVQAFLAEWDGLDKSDRVWVIGATNRRDLLDDAIVSRFGWEMQIKLPSEDDRISILHQELKSAGVEATLPAGFSALTQGMSGRDLQDAAKTARRMAHPDPPTVEQIQEAVNKLRKGQNTRVSVHSKWENLVLDQKILGRLKLISGLLRNPEKWIEQGVSIPHSLLLEGAPGTGKTEIARTLANESGLAFHAATTADLKANYLGHSGNRVKKLFEMARSHSPCILFFDELHIVAPDRSLGGDDPMTREIVGQLLQEIDGVQAQSEHVLLIGATNRPSDIDSGILSRFSERLTIPLPDREGRIRLLSIFLAGRKLDFPLYNGAALLADLTKEKDLSGRDLRNWIASAEQSALVRAMDSSNPEQYVITLDDFLSVS